MNESTTSILSSKDPVVRFEEDQDYDMIKRKLLSTGQLFVDPRFPASNTLLSSKSILEGVEWLRPAQICERLGLGVGPQLFVGTVDRFDVKQGEVGDCWFLAPLANLAENKKRFSRVVPEGQGFKKGQYAGIFRFRFWRFCEWQEVVVDDLLPTRNSRLLYLHSIDDNEFWGALLEKAYAKLHGSYHQLDGGDPLEAAVDFSGGIPETLTDPLKMDRDVLFRVVSVALGTGAFVGSVLKENNLAWAQSVFGLVGKHAYTVTKVAEVRGVRLIRVRNPWGNEGEWKGDWSDGHRFWDAIPQKAKEDLGLSARSDGEFYMSFSDFLHFFGNIDLCHLSLESADLTRGLKRTFEEATERFVGEWRVERNSDGGCGNDNYANLALNPQCFFSVVNPANPVEEDKCQVLLSLAIRLEARQRPQFPIGFKVYKCAEGDNSQRLSVDYICRNYPVGYPEPHVYTAKREVSRRLVLSPGRYCVIPSTFQRGQEGQFVLRVFVEKHWAAALNKKEVKKEEVVVKEKEVVVKEEKEEGKKDALALRFFEDGMRAQDMLQRIHGHHLQFFHDLQTRGRRKSEEGLLGGLRPGYPGIGGGRNYFVSYTSMQCHRKARSPEDAEGPTWYSEVSSQQHYFLGKPGGGSFVCSRVTKCRSKPPPPPPRLNRSRSVGGPV